MNIRELTLFKHLATSLHFGKTSKACNITPSGLTRAIQRLESELNKQLFYRDNRTVMLTTEGQIFKKYADDVLQRWIELQNELTTDEKLYGEISVYGSVTAMISILPDILANFRRQFPEVTVNIHTGDAAQALERLQEGDVDLTIAALPDNLPPNLHFIKILETPLICIGSPDYPEIIHKKNGAIDWEKAPLILPERGISRKRLYSWLKNHNIQPNIYAQVAGNEAIIAMVNMGCGVGIIPELVLQKSPLKEQISILEGGPSLGNFTVGVCTKTKNRKRQVVQHFWEVAKQSSENIQTEKQELSPTKKSR